MPGSDNAGPFAELKEGLVVCFASGRRAGTITAVRPDAFCLKDLRGETSWLRNDAIFTVDKRQVDLVCEAEGLHNYLAPD